MHPESAQPPESGREAVSSRAAKSARAGRLAALIAAVLALAVGIAVLERRALLAWAGERILAAWGINASVDVERADWRRATAVLRFGPAAAPDASLRIDAVLGWSGLSPRVLAATIDQATVRAEFDGRRLRFGALQPALDRFAGGGPPSPAPTRILVRAASVEVTGSGLAVAARIDAAAAGGSIDRLRATVTSGRWRTPEFALSVGGATLDLRRIGGGYRAELNAHGEASGTFGGRRLRAEAIALSVHAPQLFVDASAAGGPAVALGGNLECDVAASGLRSDAAQAQGAEISVTLSGARLSGIPASPRLESAFVAKFDGHGIVAPVSGERLEFRDATITQHGTLHLDAAGLAVSASAVATATVDISPAASRRLLRQADLTRIDPAAASALVAAARDLRLSVEGIVVDRRPGALRWRLERGAAVRAANRRARLVLAPIGGAALVSTVSPSSPISPAPPGSLHGAFRLRLAGRELPSVRLDVLSFRIVPPGQQPLRADAEVRFDGRLSAATFRNAVLNARLGLHAAGSRVTIALRRCASLTADAVTVADLRLERVGAKLCRGPQPLLAYAAGRWSASVHGRSLHARSAAFDVAVYDGDADVDIAGRSADLLAARFGHASLPVADLASPPRFGPLRLDGGAGYSRGRAEGEFTLGLAQPVTPLGTIRAAMSPRSGDGTATFDGLRIAFAPGGLQPAMLAPALARLASASGRAALVARARWTKSGIETSGQLRLQDFGFRSPLGELSGLNADLDLSSLYPPATASMQRVVVGRVASIVPITDLAGEFALAPDRITIGGARMHVAGGTISLDRTSVPFGAGAVMRATLRVADVGLNDILAATSLAGRVDAELRVSGSLPITYGPEGLRIEHGELHSTAPGRMAIARSVWGGEPGKSANAVRDFAYQAMEHLAVDELDGRLNSESDGRLRVVLHVRGKNAPPVAKPARVGLFALLRGQAFDHPVPLPTGTPIDLTLDSLLNVRGLFDAFRPDRSQRTAPPASTPQEKPK